MNGRLARTLLAILAGAAVLVIVGVVAYNIGVNASNGGHVVFGFGPMRGYGGDRVFGLGSGWLLWGLIPMILVVIGLIWLLAAVFGGWGRDRHPGDRTYPPAQPPMPGQPPAAGEGLDRLRELSEMHDRGALTDEEFTAAKRRLLGL